MWNKIKRALRTRIIKRWGSAVAKKQLWDQEFGNRQWDYLEHTDNDPIYVYLEKYEDKGNILDLGCGSGNTGNELNWSKYAHYNGVDISEVAIQKAELRTRENHRQAKNKYVCCDIESYVPHQQYDVILFRESIFYIPVRRIKAVLNRYSRYLRPNGIFLIRMCDREKYKPILDIIDETYSVIDKYLVDGAKDIIVVFRSEEKKVS